MASTQDDMISAVISASQCLFKLGDAGQAFKRIECELAKKPSPELTAQLFESLALLFKLAKDEEMRAFALEKAIEIRPNDTALRFSAAYSYSEASFEPLALAHYKTLLQYNPEETNALNNAGVSYARLGMDYRRGQHVLPRSIR